MNAAINLKKVLNTGSTSEINAYSDSITTCLKQPACLRQEPNHG
ncbi:MAG: hypothetical protein DRR16_16080 [Candidatus Parabeggiatoa sp. nov. 3]|nr:MAG: hypothetical protein DRR00_00595 [Gammaproteobacteria bacterium]RKZ69725.1 MAG: hypothetical protein DRQ99_00010 [Gammaproteobacteria bacterium]RKZ83924.1 MAG: hypothetical protein DRR16_16080 [Gammaproteobacteria bacterium]